MWTGRLRAGSKVWIEDTWGREPPVEVTISRVVRFAKRSVNFHFEPPAFGNTLFGWNGKCLSAYHWARKDRAECKNAST